MSWRHFCKRFCRRFETSWRRLENVLKTAWRRMTKTDMLVLIKTSWRRLKDVFWRRRVRRLYSSWSRRLLKMTDVFKTSWRRLHQDECLLGMNLNLKLFFLVTIFSLIFQSINILYYNWFQWFDYFIITVKT